MKVYLSHARKDDELAGKLAKHLAEQGMSVWLAEEQIVPGDNWAKKIGEALEDSDLLLFLVTPDAIQSDQLRHDVEFAIGSQKFEDRVFTVFMGATSDLNKDVPWILLRLPFRRVESSREFRTVAKEIQAHCATPA